MTTLKDNLALVEQQIQNACMQATRERNSVTLLAVSKTKPSSAIEQAYQLGLRHFGENYVQEAIDKIELLQALSDIVWHFIGPIQSNKTRLIAEHFAWVHSIDRAKIAQRLNEQRPEHLTPLNVCIQVNIDQEPTKSGVLPEQVLALAEQISQCQQLCLRGLMAIPKVDSNSYQQMYDLFQQVKNNYSTVDTLSLGMSNDLTSAIAHGSTMVRIGSAIFGARN